MFIFKRYKLLETLIKIGQQNNGTLNGLYQTPPDLFVEELTRVCIEKQFLIYRKKETWKHYLIPQS